MAQAQYQNTSQHNNNSQDTAWKEILDEFFKDFMDYCYPQWSQKIDWSKQYESLDKELHMITKDNLIGKRLVDKLFKVTLKNGRKQWILIHIEIQGTMEVVFPERMFTYNYRSYDRFRRPIVSIAILTDEQINWRPNRFEVKAFDSCLSLDYSVIKLLDYREKHAECEASNNIFATVILTQLAAIDMKHKSPKERFNMKFQLTRRLYEKGFSKNQIKKLYLFLDWVIQLPQDLEKKFKKSVYKFEESKKMPYISSIERMGIEKGIEKGMEKGMEKGIQLGQQRGEAKVLLHQLKLKFKKVPTKYINLIEKTDEKTLLTWCKRVLEAKKIADIFKK